MANMQWMRFATCECWCIIALILVAFLRLNRSVLRR